MGEAGKLSATKIGVYTGCPFYFYLKYVKHVKVPTGVQLMFGRDIHYMLEQFYKKKWKTKESYTNYWKYRWWQTCSAGFMKGKQKEDINITEHQFKLSNGKTIPVPLGDHIAWRMSDPCIEFFSQKKLGVRLLSEYWDRHQGEEAPLGLEDRFCINFRGYDIQGVIDRVEKKGDQLLLIDYKSNKHPPSNHVLRHAVQFTIYALACKELYGKEPDEILFYHLRSGKLFRTTRGPADFDYLEQICRDITESIQNDIWIPHYGYNCNFCDYQDPCAQYNYTEVGPVLKEHPVTAELEEWVF